MKRCFESTETFIQNKRVMLVHHENCAYKYSHLPKPISVKRKLGSTNLNNEIENDGINENKHKKRIFIPLIYNCSSHDDDKNICQMYNCSGFDSCKLSLEGDDINICMEKNNDESDLMDMIYDNTQDGLTCNNTNLYKCNTHNNDKYICCIYDCGGVKNHKIKSSKQYLSYFA